MTETNTKKTDSKSNTSSSLDSKVDYILLNVEEKEYKYLNIIDKFRLRREGHKSLFESKCKSCGDDDLTYYKSTYSIKNPEVYDKKNIPLKDRARELYFVFGECQSCNTKQRLSDRMFEIKY
ncbi:MAG TPA: hypothetical protein VEC16_06015 [Alphaproteobacteria bacterium]|nr:hypothetical protein [Alphaproteobacteria bacterium]